MVTVADALAALCPSDIPDPFPELENPATSLGSIGFAGTWETMSATKGEASERGG